MKKRRSSTLFWWFFGTKERNYLTNKLFLMLLRPAARNLGLGLIVGVRGQSSSSRDHRRPPGARQNAQRAAPCRHFKHLESIQTPTQTFQQGRFIPPLERRAERVVHERFFNPVEFHNQLLEHSPTLTHAGEMEDLQQMPWSADPPATARRRGQTHRRTRPHQHY